MSVLTQFEVLSLLGNGGMGEVYKARLYNSHGFERIVAAKRVSRSSEASVKSILNEAKLLAKLNHPNICSIIDLREKDLNLYILMEFIDGYDIGKIHDLSRQKNFRFSELFLWIVAKKVLTGLSHAHGHGAGQNPILHRDISANNLMVSKAGQIKIMDFGLAKIDHVEHTESNSSNFGKLRYCAPEILDGQAYSIRCDLYSVGVILFELASGTKAFDGLTESETMWKIVNSDLNFDTLKANGYSEAFQQFIRALCAKQVKASFTTADDARKFIASHSGILGAIDAEESVKFEIEKLLIAGIDRTKTLVGATIPKRQKRMIAPILMGCAVVLVVASVLFAKFPSNNSLLIRVKAADAEVDLVRKRTDTTIDVGGELGNYMRVSACKYAGTALLSLPSLIFDSEVSEKLRRLGMESSPGALLGIVNQNFQRQSTAYELLKRNCSHEKSFEIAAVMYEDLRLKVPEFAKNKFVSFEILKSFAVENAIFSEQKYRSLFKFADLSLESPQQSKLLKDQIEALKVFDVEPVTGYILFQVSPELFPKNTDECRILFDTLWVKTILDPKTGAGGVKQFSAVLVPFPINAEIESYGSNFIQYKTVQNLDETVFKKYGICVYSRINGEVVESSLRRL